MQRAIYGESAKQDTTVSMIAMILFIGSGIVCSNWARFRSLRQRFCRLNIERMDFISSKVFAKGFGFRVERDVAATCAQVRMWFGDWWVAGKVGEKACCVREGVEYCGTGRGFGVG